MLLLVVFAAVGFSNEFVAVSAVVKVVLLVVAVVAVHYFPCC